MKATASRPPSGITVPPSVQRRAGIKAGAPVSFAVSKGVITITPAYQPTPRELVAIAKGEREIAGGDSVTLNEILHDLERGRRKVGPKATRKSTG